MKTATQTKKSEAQLEMPIRKRYPRFARIRPTSRGSYIVFSLNETTEILVNSNYLLKILETAKKRQAQDESGDQ